MYTGSLPTVANNETWELALSFTDDGTKELIDFTGCLIEMDVRDENRCRLISASTDDGGIVLVEPTVAIMTVAKSVMSKICAGTYSVTMTASRDGRYASLINGYVPVIS